MKRMECNYNTRLLAWKIGLLYLLSSPANGFVFFPSVMTIPQANTAVPHSASSCSTTPVLSRLGEHQQLLDYQNDDHQSSERHRQPQRWMMIMVPRTRTEGQELQQERKSSSSFSFRSASSLLLSRAIGSLIFGISACIARGRMVDVHNAKAPPPYVASLLGVVLLVGVGMLPSSRQQQ